MIYRLPYSFRSTAVGGCDESHDFCSVMILRDNPCLVFHRQGGELPPASQVEQQLIGLNRRATHIVADNVEAAISEFDGYEHAKAGAIWIDTEFEPIIELPHCPQLHQNSRKEFICGQPLTDPEELEAWGEAGEGGFCIFAGYDAPEHCPVTPILAGLPANYDELRQSAGDVTNSAEPSKSFKFYRATAVTVPD